MFPRSYILQVRSKLSNGGSTAATSEPVSVHWTYIVCDSAQYGVIRGNDTLGCVPCPDGGVCSQTGFVQEGLAVSVAESFPGVVIQVSTCFQEPRPSLKESSPIHFGCWCSQTLWPKLAIGLPQDRLDWSTTRAHCRRRALEEETGRGLNALSDTLVGTGYLSLHAVYQT